MRYTPGQLRQVLGLTKETLRYWKKELPALKASAGHSPCFGPGDILAAAIVKSAVETGGVPVGKLASVAPNLFDFFRHMSWFALERCTLVLPLAGGKMELLESQLSVGFRGPTLVVPLGPIVQELREKLFEADAGDIDPQGNLSFPPVSIASRGRA